MKVLFITSRGHDLASIFLYDGLCDLVGEENVVCAEDYFWLSCHDGGGGRILQRHKWEPFNLDDGDFGNDFNLIVINACFNRDHPWSWAKDVVTYHLKQNGVVAYVEGWDDAAGEVFPPQGDVPIHRVFRREILPGHKYPYAATPLLWAPPAWWYDEPRLEKTCQVSCLCSVSAVAVRWPIMSKVFQTGARFTAAVGTLPFDQYLEITRRSRFVIVPPGGGSDCVRQWEAIAAGCIPIFVGHPPRVREPWFAADEILQCSVDELPAMIDYALSQVDFHAMQAKLEKRARAEHTTRARAERLVKLTGVVE